MVGVIAGVGVEVIVADATGAVAVGGSSVGGAIVCGVATLAQAVTTRVKSVIRKYLLLCRIECLAIHSHRGGFGWSGSPFI
jgi:cephalosporin-C deacetylase-like acetyl esterase